MTRIPVNPSLAIRDGWEVKKRTKEHLTRPHWVAHRFNGTLQRRQLVLPAQDSEVEDQFTTHTYTRHNCLVAYSKGNDHVVDAV